MIQSYHTLLQGLALGIILSTSFLSRSNIDKVYADYSEDKRNLTALQQLLDAKDPLQVATILNEVLAALMLLSFVISGITLGKPMRSAPKVSDE